MGAQENIQASDINPDNSYPNVYEDPDPASIDTSSGDVVEQIKIVAWLREEIYDALSAVSNDEEQLWMDFICTFRPNSVHEYHKEHTYKYCNFIRSQGIHVDNGREVSYVEALKRILVQKVPIQAKLITSDEEDHGSNNLIVRKLF